MPTTFEWVVVDTDVLVQCESLPDVVTAVNWRYQGTNGTYTASVHGKTKVDEHHPGHAFIPFEQLTQAEVIQWVIDDLGPDAIQGFQNSIEEQLQNHVLTVVTKPLVNN
jgi:DNA polymerase II large subunit